VERFGLLMTLPYAKMEATGLIEILASQQPVNEGIINEKRSRNLGEHANFENALSIYRNQTVEKRLYKDDDSQFAPSMIPKFSP
jgi:hypothetical protein